MHRSFFQLLINFAILALTLCSVSCAFAEISSANAQANALKALGNKHIPLTLNGFSSIGSIEGRGKKCYSFEGPKDEGLNIDVDTSSGLICQLSWSRLRVESTEVRLTLEEAASRANEFLLNQKVLPMNGVAITHSTFLNRGDGGKLYSFIWSKNLNGVSYPLTIKVMVSASSGSIVDYLLIEHAVTLQSITPKISKQQAISIATPKIDLPPGWKVVNVQLAIAGAESHQTLQWIIRIQGTTVLPYTPEKGQIQVEESRDILINAITGQYINMFKRIPNSQPVQLRSPAPRASQFTVAEFWPSWSQEKAGSILFYIWHEMEAGAVANTTETQKTNHARSLVAMVYADKITNLLQTPSFILHYPSWTQDGSRIAFDVYLGGIIYILDIKTGTIGQCNDGERARREMPSWDPSGKLLAMAGTFSGSTDSDDDIFVAKIVDKLSRVSMDRNWCVAKMPGQDILPIFSPDGQYIVFAHQEPASSNATQPNNSWSLYRVKADTSYKDKAYEPPQKIVDSLPFPERLSFFPDGKRVLVSYSDNEYEMKHPPEMVDIEAKTHKPLSLPILHDPDLAKSQPLIVREPAVDPTGTKIAFRALRWSGNPQDDGAICIYTCNLDGSDLKRITPPTAQPLEPYQYPEPGITALNAWEKLEPQPNLGSAAVPH